MPFKHSTSGLGALAALALCAGQAHGITDTHWIGGEDDWYDAANWSDTAGGPGGGTVPTATYRPVINNGGIVNLMGSGNVTIDTVDIGATAVGQPTASGTFNIGDSVNLTMTQGFFGNLGNNSGTATINQTGSSTVTVDNLWLGGGPVMGGPGGTVHWNLDSPDTTLNITNDLAISWLEHGQANLNVKQGTVNFSSSDNKLNVGHAPNRVGSITLGQTGDAFINENSSGQNMELRYVWSAGNAARIEGVGVINMTGSLDLNGQVTANGWGREATLDMSSFSEIISVYGDDYNVTNTIYGEGSGWWATNQGELRLPTVAVTAGAGPTTYRWGQGQYNRVHSVLLTFEGVGTGGDVDIALLADDRAELGTTKAETAAAGGSINGVWRFDAAPQLTFDTVTLSFRVDDYALAVGEEENLTLYTSVGDAWVDVSTLPGVTLTRNLSDNIGHADRHTITASGLSGFSYYAIGTNITGTIGPVPEPATLGLLIGGGVLLLGRRGRREVVSSAQNAQR